MFADSEVKLLSRGSSKPQDLIVLCWWLSHQKPVGIGFTVRVRPQPRKNDSETCKVSPPAWQWRWKQSYMFSAELPRGVTAIYHTPSFSYSVSLWKWKLEWAAHTGVCQCSTSTLIDSSGVLDLSEWMEWADTVGRKCSHHKWLASRMTWNVEEAETILEHTIDRLEERGLEGARDRQSPFKGPSSVRRTLVLEMQSWGNFLETGKALMGFSERVYNYTFMYLTDLPHQTD